MSRSVPRGVSRLTTTRGGMRVCLVGRRRCGANSLPAVEAPPSRRASRTSPGTLPSAREFGPSAARPFAKVPPAMVRPPHGNTGGLKGQTIGGGEGRDAKHSARGTPMERRTCGCYRLPRCGDASGRRGSIGPWRPARPRTSEGSGLSAEARRSGGGRRKRRGPARGRHEERAFAHPTALRK